MQRLPTISQTLFKSLAKTTPSLLLRSSSSSLKSATFASCQLNPAAVSAIHKLNTRLFSSQSNLSNVVNGQGNSDSKNNGQHQQNKKKSAFGVWAAALGTAAVGAISAATWAFATQEQQTALAYGSSSKVQIDPESKLPIEEAILTIAPNVPPPITRKHPALVKVYFTSDVYEGKLTNNYKYKFWGYNNSVPGPFIRVRVGDIMDFTMKNNDMTGMPHNVDFHSVSGPGGGAHVTLAESGDTKHARFKMVNPGLYVYHCAAAPIPMHIANGMYGLILVEPEEGLPKADKEYYVMQSEFYFEPPEDGESNVAEYSYQDGMREQASAVVFNGREGSLTQDMMLKANVGDNVRIYFGNGGPNLTSSFHVIGAIFDKVYREGDLLSPPARSVQTTLVPAGGSAVVELVPKYPGNLTLVDHAIFRIEKGATGFISVTGPKDKSIYWSDEGPKPCPGCKVHP